MKVSMNCCERRLVPLLLLYLLVAEAAPDCPKPQAMGNVVLTNEALLKNGFPEGSDITFECVQGYERHNGSSITTCTGGQWTELTLSCKKKDCGVPRALPNMRFEFGENGTILGATVKVVCDKGYRLSGTAYKQCYATGWIGRTKCSVSKCPEPSKIDNGRNSWIEPREPTYGEVIQFFCDQGYTLYGNSYVTCSELGQYSSKPPVCEVESLSAMNTTTVPSGLSTSLSTIKGGKHIFATEDNFIEKTSIRSDPLDSSTTSIGTISTNGITVTPSPSAPSVPGNLREGDTNKGRRYVVLISVVCTSIAVIVFLCLLYQVLLRKKGSYDTGEDLKPELLPFQRL